MLIELLFVATPFLEDKPSISRAKFVWVWTLFELLYMPQQYK